MFLTGKCNKAAGGKPRILMHTVVLSHPSFRDGTYRAQ
jgi:hypothetical protein